MDCVYSENRCLDSHWWIAFLRLNCLTCLYLGSLHWSGDWSRPEWQTNRLYQLWSPYLMKRCLTCAEINLTIFNSCIRIIHWMKVVVTFCTLIKFVWVHAFFVRCLWSTQKLKPHPHCFSSSDMSYLCGLLAVTLALVLITQTSHGSTTLKQVPLPNGSPLREDGHNSHIQWLNCGNQL